MKVSRDAFRRTQTAQRTLSPSSNFTRRALPSQFRPSAGVIQQSASGAPQTHRSLLARALGVIGLGDRHPYTAKQVHNKWVFLENIAAALPFSASAHFVWRHKIVGGLYSAGLLGLSLVSMLKVGAAGEALHAFFTTPLGTLVFVFKLAFHLEHLRALTTPYHPDKLPPPTLLLDFFNKLRRVPLVAQGVSFVITAFLLEANFQVSNGFKYDPETFSGMMHDVGYNLPLGASGYLQTILLLGLTASVQAGSRDRFSRITRAPMDAPVFFYNECRRHPLFATGVIAGVTTLVANTVIDLGAQQAIFTAIKDFPLNAPGWWIAFFSGMAAIRAMALGQQDSQVKRQGDSPWHRFVKWGMHKSLGKVASSVAAVFTGFYALRLTGATELGAYMAQAINGLSWRWILEPGLLIAETFALATFVGYFRLWLKGIDVDPGVNADQKPTVDLQAVVDLEERLQEEGR